MARGLISGVLWGAALAVMSLWLLSQISGMVGLLSEPRDVAVLAPDGGGGGSGTQVGAAPATPIRQGSPATDPSRQGGELEDGDTDNAPSAGTASAQVPVAANVAEAPAIPEAGAAPELNTLIEPSTSSGADTATLQAPGDEAAPELALQPAVPSASNVTGGQASPEAGAAPDVSAQIKSPAAAQADTTELLAPGEEAALVSPSQPPVPPGQSSDEIVAANAQMPAAETGVELSPVSSPSVGSEPAQPQNPVADAVPENDFSAPTVVATPATVEPEPEPEPPEPSGVEVDVVEADTPAPSPGLATVVDRSGGTVPTDEAGEPEEVAETVEAEPGPAIEKFAEPFDNPQALPLMAILLLPDESASGGVASLTPLPFPVSYVVDASLADANFRMRQIRDAGLEVAMLTPLPSGATPRDVEVAFQSYVAAVPEAVAVMDVPDAAFQSRRDVANQVAAALAARGLGMVTYSRGLNSAAQVAGRAGVPAALVFRVIDGNDRNRAAIKRFLDQAAFRAGQRSGVVLVGHDRAETIAALQEWALGNRASTVALAPLSAVLLGR